MLYIYTIYSWWCSDGATKEPKPRGRHSSGVGLWAQNDHVTLWPRDPRVVFRLSSSASCVARKGLTCHHFSSFFEGTLRNMRPKILQYGFIAKWSQNGCSMERNDKPWDFRDPIFATLHRAVYRIPIVSSTSNSLTSGSMTFLWPSWQTCHHPVHEAWA